MTKFIYVAGMACRPYGVVKPAPKAAEIDTKKICDISFIVREVELLLITTERADMYKSARIG